MLLFSGCVSWEEMMMIKQQFNEHINLKHIAKHFSCIVTSPLTRALWERNYSYFMQALLTQISRAPSATHIQAIWLCHFFVTSEHPSSALNVLCLAAWGNFVLSFEKGCIQLSFTYSMLCLGKLGDHKLSWYKDQKSQRHHLSPHMLLFFLLFYYIHFFLL